MFLGCNTRMVTRIVRALDIQPVHVSKSGKRRLYSLKSAQIRRVILEYNRLRDQKGHAAGQMRRRNLNLSGSERLERYYIRAREKNREKAEKERERRRAERAKRAVESAKAWIAGAPVVAGLAAEAATVRHLSTMVGGAAGEALESALEPPADGASTDAESLGDLAF